MDINEQDDLPDEFLDIPDDYGDAARRQIIASVWEERQKQFARAIESPAVARAAKETVDRELATMSPDAYRRFGKTFESAAIQAQQARQPDWEKWKRVPHIVTWEGVALSMNIEPSKVLRDKHDHFDESDEFKDRIFIAGRAVSSVDLASSASLKPDGPRFVRLPQFVEWAQSIEWDMPKELIALASSPRAENSFESSIIGATPNPMPEPVDSPNWKIRIQAEAARIWRHQRSYGANPTKHGIKDELATWARDNGIKTKSGINPNAEYIARHVIKDWTPPAD